MKKIKFSCMLLLASISILTSSCDKDDDSESSVTVTFEDIQLGAKGFWAGDTTGTASVGMYGTDYNGHFTIKEGTFHNTYTVSDYGSSWKGFGLSSLADTSVDGKYQNEMYVFDKSGADGSKQFAIAYSNATVDFSSPVSLKSVMVNNSTYTYKVIKNGNEYSTAFTKDSWFKVTFKGFDKEGKEVGTVDVLLADYMNGKNEICNAWKKVDLSSISNASKITISFDGTDKGDWGLNTPSYVCLDNLVFSQK